MPLAWLVPVVLLVAAPRAAVGGEPRLLWDDVHDEAGATDFARAAAVTRSSAVAIGTVRNTADNDDFAVRAYDLKTGALRWEDVHDATGGDDEATAVGVTEARAIVAGWVRNGIDRDLVVRAYDLETGGLRWQDVEDTTGGDDQATAVAVTGTIAMVAGRLGPGFAVRAYHIATGALHWTDAQELGQALAVTVKGQTAIVVGRLLDGPFGSDFVVRAYDVTTGTLRWENVHDATGGDDQAQAVAMTRETAIVVGQLYESVHNGDFAVRAYDVKTGMLRWEDVLDGAGFIDSANAVAVIGRLAIVVGFSRNAFLDDDLVVRAYDVKTGALRWSDVHNQGPGSRGRASSVAVKGKIAFVGGQIDGDLVMRTYHKRTGALRWHDVRDDPGEDSALSVAITGRTAIVAGFGEPQSGNHDFAVRAYRLRAAAP